MILPCKSWPGDYLKAHKNKINMDRVRKMHDQMVELTRSFYDDINEAGLRNGEEALEFRQNYIPSLQAIEEGGWINRLLRGMGIETMADELPTSIAGKTEEFRPVRKWQQFRQQRRGTDTEFDAVKAMDQYITNAAHAIYHTDDIHNLRTLEEAIRYKHSTEGGQAELDAIRQNPELSIDERTAKEKRSGSAPRRRFPLFRLGLRNIQTILRAKRARQIVKPNMALDAVFIAQSATLRPRWPLTWSASMCLRHSQTLFRLPRARVNCAAQV